MAAVAVHPTTELLSDLVQAFQDTPVSIISDNLERLAGVEGLRPFHRSGRMCGVALTVKTRSGDNLVIHQALELMKPGDVLVVDGGADPARALVGEIMKTIAEFKGAAGFVIDGAIRDAAAFAQSDFPCFARSATHKGPYKNGPGVLNVPVSIGGCVIEPGDIVVGDEDGVIAFNPNLVPALREAVGLQLKSEASIMESIRRGTYKGAYRFPSHDASQKEV